MTSDMTGTIPEGSTEQWRDKKRHLWLIGLVIPSAVFIIYTGWAVTGWSVWFWSGPLLILVIVPLIDLVTGIDTSNPPDEVIEQLENDKYYRWITYWFLPIQYFGFFAVMAWIGGHNPGVWITKLLRVHDNLVASGASARLTQNLPLDTIDKVALAISIGCVAGIGINTAHELGHKKESVERWLSKIALAQSFYGHFYIEHNRGHHVRVATPEDPASARMGENFYQFWPRTVSGSLKSAWHLEAKRYARKGKHPFQVGNDVLNAWVMSAVLFGGVTLWLGVGILPYLLLNAVVGFSLLEVINFVEHYGMLRQKVGEGDRERYERVNPSHSWNSNQIATNVLLYHLQRHSDHHANPTRRYQALRDFKESPVLPTGYAGMIVLAVVPAIYRRTMWPLVVAHFDGDLTLANISPRKRDKILALFPPPAAHPEFEHVDTRVEVDPHEVLAARCPGCGYTYDVVVGNELEGFAAGTAWKDIPDDWCCPDCGVREKVDFVPVERVDA
jgi:alkane 1-monooxygenase